MNEANRLRTLERQVQELRGMVEQLSARDANSRRGYDWVFCQPNEDLLPGRYVFAQLCKITITQDDDDNDIMNVTPLASNQKVKVGDLWNDDGRMISEGTTCLAIKDPYTGIYIVIAVWGCRSPQEE